MFFHLRMIAVSLSALCYSEQRPSTKASQLTSKPNQPVGYAQRAALTRREHDPLLAPAHARVPRTRCIGVHVEGGAAARRAHNQPPGADKSTHAQEKQKQQWQQQQVELSNEARRSIMFM
jgi:hypothetical protein